jgi:putative zinc finger protein
MDCSEADTMLTELALDVLPGDRRAAILAHVERCPHCRQVLEELTETADDLLLAGPAAAPPAGFDDRVLEQIQGVQGRGVQGPDARRRRDRAALRLPTWAAAAAAVVLLVTGGVTGAVIGRSSNGSDESAEPLRTFELISTSGTDIGDVSTYTGDPSPWLFMRVEGDVPDATYRCVLDMDDGRTVPIGRLWAVKGHGGWGEHLSEDPRHAVAARLLDPKGATVATARFR